MTGILLWINFHRMLMLGLMALATWGAAYGLYLKNQVRTIMHRGKPHSWSVDLHSKTATFNGKPEV